LGTRSSVVLLVVGLILSVAGCAPADNGATAIEVATSASVVPSLTATMAMTPSTVSASPPPPTAPIPPPTPEPSVTPKATRGLSTPTRELPTPTLEPETSTATPSATHTPTAYPSPTATAGVSANLDRISIDLIPVVGGFDTPVGIASARDDSGRLFVLEKVGRIRLVREGALVAEPFLDLTDRVGSVSNEQGLLGLAFHPEYPQVRSFFVNYTDRQGNTVLSRFVTSDNPDRADMSSEAVLLTLDQPAGNHNGGHLAFGPDGTLYIGTGDGGGSGDRYGNGQNGQTLLGAMLRLDVDGGQPYGIPANNPFLDNAAVRDEIWAVGLRNPWRYSFDRLTGDLYIADVGQNVYEEVNVQPAGDRGGNNYGWPIMEGLHCFPANRDCDRNGLTLPVAEYDHAQGCSVTGGYVYRGQTYPFLNGVYLFGDYCSGRIWGMAREGTAGNWQVSLLAQTGVRLSSFGEDETGELYLVDIVGGQLFQIAAQLR
jgi:glucose/arabinose dehydrogenase